MAMLVGGAGTEVQMQRYCAGGSTGVDWWPSVSGPRVRRLFQGDAEEGPGRRPWILEREKVREWCVRSWKDACGDAAGVAVDGRWRRGGPPPVVAGGVQLRRRVGRDRFAFV